MTRRKFRVSTFVMYAAIFIFSMICLLPMILLIMVSVTDENVIEKYGYQFIPKKFSLYAYQLIFHNGSGMLRAFAVSGTVTVVGTALAVLITATAAYTLANKNVHYRNGIALFFFIPMIFTSGIVPWYLICRQLSLTNNIWALIVPSLLFNPFNLFLVRNFMQGIPDALRESATLDGANDAVIALRIYFPLCVPVLATVSLFYGLAYWNDWWNAIMLIDNSLLYPLQYYLLQLQSQINMINQLQSLSGVAKLTQPTEAIKMATAVVTIGPIVFLYPALQRYFVSGLIIGSVKG